MSAPVLALFTDYGLGGPWVGQLHAVIRRRAPQAAIIDLQHDLPSFRPRGAGILLAAQLHRLPEGSTVVAVVDPGVGGSRAGLVLELEGRRLVGPDNGLFAPLLGRAARIARIDWQPADLSATFHGRDWFTPVALRLALGEPVALRAVAAGDCVGHAWGTALPEIIYQDRFGNLVTGLGADALAADAVIRVGQHELQPARTFSEVPPGTPFWHVDALGLVELSVNQGSAAELLDLKVGDPVPVFD